MLNASQNDVKILAPEHGIEVVASTAPLTAASRPVNPIEVELAVANAATGALLGTFAVKLRRGQNLTFLVRSDGVELIENAYGPVVTMN